MNQDQVLSLVRSALKILGAWAVTSGYMTDGQFTEVLGGASVLVGLFMSHFTHEKKP